MSQDHEDSIPPCPPLTLTVDVSSDAAANDAALLAMPAKPGVLIIEDESGGTLSLLQSADLRRATRVRLGPLDPDQSRTRRADLRPVAHRVRACTVGSAFEADWATLQLARQYLPHSYRSMLDRWQAWFVHCDADAAFPQWVKTAHPTEQHGMHIGPIADKHAAARFREMLEDAFDLCRYHHILVQAPHGSACAYKEMGRCPAPCDGSVTMEHYRRQIDASIAFATSPKDARQSLETQMSDSAAAMDFEQASRCKTLLERTAISTRSEFAHIRDFECFRFLAVLPAERSGYARLFAIAGGWISPIIDVAADADPGGFREAITAAEALAPRSVGRSAADIENIGMVCRHLLLPKAQAKRRRAEFVHWHDRDNPNPAVLNNAVRRVLAKLQHEPAREDDRPGSSDSEIEIGA